MDRLFASLDIYCERTDASFWSEPVNALTNLLIVVAGVFGLAQVRSRKTGVYAEILCWWVVVIGAVFIFINKISDVLYRVLDPRAR